MSPASLNLKKLNKRHQMKTTPRCPFGFSMSAQNQVSGEEMPLDKRTNSIIIQSPDESWEQITPKW